jgi:glycosyltransferase involved in cell wall biosynthesis
LEEIKTKIVMIGPNIEGYGGISRVVKIWKESRLFNEMGVKYISSTPPGEASSVKKLIHIFKVIKNFIYVCKTCKCLVYIHSASINSFYRKSIFILLALILKKKIILHIHSSYFSEFLSNFNSIKKLIFFSLLYRVESFVALTEGIKTKLQVIFPLKKIYVLSNPIDTNKFFNNKKKIRLHNRLLYLGHFLPEKGVYDLVDAISILTKNKIDIEVDFYGTKGSTSLKNYIMKKGLDSRKIRVNGWISGEKKINAFCSCTMLILPSHTEGFPNVILEAMATETPIISTNVGGLKDLLRDGENSIIISKKNAIDLSNKIQSCLLDDNLRSKIAKNGKMEVLKYYDINVIKNEIVNILNSISLKKTNHSKR